MYAATRGPNVKWGAQISNGGAGTTAPPLATALRVLCSQCPPLFFETWSTYRRLEHRLNAFHFRCLRSTSDVSWHDRAHNAFVMEFMGITRISTMLQTIRLRWAGHVQKQEDDRLSNDPLYIGSRHPFRQSPYAPFQRWN